MNICPTMNSRFVSWVTSFLAAIRWICAVVKERAGERITCTDAARTRYGAMLMGEAQNWSRVFVSEDQLHGTVWIHISRGVTQWPCESSEFIPEIEGTDCFYGQTAVAQAQPEDPDLCIGRPTAFRPEITPPPPDRLLGGPIAFQSPSGHGKHTSKPRESHIGERRWYGIDYNGRNSKEPKMISKAFTIIVSPPHSGWNS